MSIEIKKSSKYQTILTRLYLKFMEYNMVPIQVVAEDQKYVIIGPVLDLTRVFLLTKTQELK